MLYIDGTLCGIQIITMIKSCIKYFDQGFEDGLPIPILDMFDMDYDFPPRVHCLSRWYVK